MHKFHPKFIYIVVAALVLASCRVEVSTARGEIVVSSSPMVYDKDDRIDVGEIKKSSLVKLKNASAAIIKKHNVDNFISISERSNLCEDEKFATENSIGECSSFLVAPNIMMTAGHCIYMWDNTPETFCDNFAFVFDYYKDKTTHDEVYECKSVIYAINDFKNYKDIALVLLDKKVMSRKPLKVSTRLKLGAQVASVGSPLGAPLKLSKEGTIQNISERSFEYSLDLFAGNSGSPIFDIEQEAVIGVHTYGSTLGITLDEESKCNRYNHCISEEGEFDCFDLGGFAGGSIIHSIPRAYLKLMDVILPTSR